MKNGPQNYEKWGSKIAKFYQICGKGVCVYILQFEKKNGGGGKFYISLKKKGGGGGYPAKPSY